MQINIRTKDLEATEELKQYVEEKIGELDRFINVNEGDFPEGKATVQNHIEIEKTTQHHKKGPYYRAEATVSLPGKEIWVDARGEDWKEAVDELKDELKRELKKYKGKSRAVSRRKRRFFKRLVNLSPLARLRRKGGRDKLEGN